MIHSTFICIRFLRLMAGVFVVPCGCTATSPAASQSLQHHIVTNGAIDLHCVSTGSGPLIVMLHGFPDFWFTWEQQLIDLRSEFHVVAFDLRGYNHSSKPAGSHFYQMTHLVSDLKAVIEYFSPTDRAIVVGHDWGAAVAWSFAAEHPQMTMGLIACGFPHPQALARELESNEQQQTASQYVTLLLSPGFETLLTSDLLLLQTGLKVDRQRYEDAFKRSDLSAMLNYYRENFPLMQATPNESLELRIAVPTVVIHGRNDPYLLPQTLDSTWQWIDETLSLIIVPDAGHWVHHDAKEKVSRYISFWANQFTMGTASTHGQSNTTKGTD